MDHYEPEDNSIRGQIERRFSAAFPEDRRRRIARIDSQCFIVSLLMEEGWLEETLISLARCIKEKQQGLVFFKRVPIGRVGTGFAYIFCYGFRPADVCGFQLYILGSNDYGQSLERDLLAMIECDKESLAIHIVKLFDEASGWLIDDPHDK